MEISFKRVEADRSPKNKWIKQRGRALRKRRRAFLKFSHYRRIGSWDKLHTLLLALQGNLTVEYLIQKLIPKLESITEKKISFKVFKLRSRSIASNSLLITDWIVDRIEEDNLRPIKIIGKALCMYRKASRRKMYMEKKASHFSPKAQFKDYDFVYWFTSRLIILYNYKMRAIKLARPSIKTKALNLISSSNFIANGKNKNKAKPQTKALTLIYNTSAKTRLQQKPKHKFRTISILQPKNNNISLWTKTYKSRAKAHSPWAKRDTKTYNHSLRAKAYSLNSQTKNLKLTKAQQNWNFKVHNKDSQAQNRNLQTKVHNWSYQPKVQVQAKNRSPQTQDWNARAKAQNRGPQTQDWNARAKTQNRGPQVKVNNWNYQTKTQQNKNKSPQAQNWNARAKAQNLSPQAKAQNWNYQTKPQTQNKSKSLQVKDWNSRAKVQNWSPQTKAHSLSSQAQDLSSQVKAVGYQIRVQKWKRNVGIGVGRGVGRGVGVAQTFNTKTKDRAQPQIFKAKGQVLVKGVAGAGTPSYNTHAPKAANTKYRAQFQSQIRPKNLIAIITPQTNINITRVPKAAINFKPQPQINTNITRAPKAAVNFKPQPQINTNIIHGRKATNTNINTNITHSHGHKAINTNTNTNITHSYDHDRKATNTNFKFKPQLESQLKGLSFISNTKPQSHNTHVPNPNYNPKPNFKFKNQTQSQSQNQNNLNTLSPRTKSYSPKLKTDSNSPKLKSAGAQDYKTKPKA